MAKNRTRTALRPTLISLAVASCFAAGTALANPTGAKVVHGTADIHRVGNLLQITNSPNAIINWQSFSIGANEITRFIQQSNSSAVLNRVTTQNPSVILGSLQSRLSNGMTGGKVFLINPNGIVFGKGSRVDVGGLVASSLQLSDADFLAGKLRFGDGLGKGVVSEGNITTSAGGSVYLVGSAVTNGGIITSPGGEVVLAAGNSVELVNPGTPNLRVEVAASDHEARNLGQIMSDAGRIGIYAGLVNNSGTIRADSALKEGGRILLKATQNATLEAGSVTTANGARGGSVTVQSGGTTLVSGKVEAKGTNGPGGTVQALGHLVGLIGNASINASGTTGGGAVLVGGDYQGGNPGIQNAFRTYMGADVTINADAVTGGDGGKVIVWSDDATRAYGTISARGGAQSGNGGFVEVSGKNYLDYQGRTIATAPKGKSGTLLLDPADVVINTVGNSIGEDDGSFDAPTFFLSGVTPSFIRWSTIQQQLDPILGSNVIINTVTGQQLAEGNITIAANSPDLATSNTLQLIADGKIFVNNRITNSGTGAVVLQSGTGISQTSTGVITANQLYADGGTGTVQLSAATNMVNTLAGRATRSFSFKNGKSLTIGNVPAIQGFGIDVLSGSGSTLLNINVTSGNLTVNQVGVNASGGSYRGSVNLTAAGSVQVQNGSSIRADGAEGAGITLNALGGNIMVSSSNVNANGSVFINQGTSATIALNAAGDVTVDGGEGLFATGGGSPLQQNLSGGSASIDVVAGGNISVLSGSSVSARGGTGTQQGGSATVNFTAGGTIVARDTPNSISAFGGDGAVTGGSATIAMTANGMTFDNARVRAAAYADPNCDCTFPDNAGSGLVSLNALGGTINLMNGAVVEASGGSGNVTNGTVQINLAFTGRATGGYFINGVEGLIVDGDLRASTTGFFVNGQPAILGTNLLVAYSGFAFVDPLIGAMNQQIDVLADQLKAGDTGLSEDKEKKKLPYCSS